MDLRPERLDALASPRIAAAKVTMDLVETCLCWSLTFLVTLIVLLVCHVTSAIARGNQAAVLWLAEGEEALMAESKVRAHALANLLHGKSCSPAPLDGSEERRTGLAIGTASAPASPVSERYKF